jgi:hypothetical protein
LKEQCLVCPLYFLCWCFLNLITERTWNVSQGLVLTGCQINWFDIIEICKNCLRCHLLLNKAKFTQRSQKKNNNTDWPQSVVPWVTFKSPFLLWLRTTFVDPSQLSYIGFQDALSSGPLHFHMKPFYFLELVYTWVYYKPFKASLEIHGVHANQCATIQTTVKKLLPQEAGTSLLLHILSCASRIQFQPIVIRLLSNVRGASLGKTRAGSLWAPSWSYSSRPTCALALPLRYFRWVWAMRALFGLYFILFCLFFNSCTDPFPKKGALGQWPQPHWPWKWRSTQLASAWHCPLSCKQRSRGICSGSQSSPSPT